jgi:CRISPR-associated endonuclease/helicase Cas3
MNNTESEHDDANFPLYYKYWGKAKKKDDGGWDYHLLVYHCLDVAAVGRVILNNNELFKSLKKIATSHNFSAENLLLLLLAVHDFGKFSKSFQSIIPEVQLLLQGVNRGNSGVIRHDSLGVSLWKSKYFEIISEILINQCGQKTSISILNTIQSFIYCTAGHHGVPPNPNEIILDDYFDGTDYKSLEYFWFDLQSLFKMDGLFTDLNKLQLLTNSKELLQSASWEIAGFITFADWIGSNSNYFNFISTPIPLEKYWSIAINNAEKAIQGLGLVKPNTRKQYSLKTFLPNISENPTPLQDYCNTCKLSHNPQLWILEDVTGAGKTEAALILTARLIANGLGNGVFIALPTMATSDAMYKRLSTQYSRLFEDNSYPSIVLAHGARHLSKEFRESFLDSSEKGYSYTDDNNNDAAAQCNRWFTDTNKKALLADAGVGTIDQVLISVLPSRHQSLRLYGLHGKILIIDEVHAYDSYQHRLLCGVIENHARNGGSAILLSATLPKYIRESLANAYLKGSGIYDKAGLQKDNYPLATCVSNCGSVIEEQQDTRLDLKRSVTIQFQSDYNKIPELLMQKAKEGKCGCWIRNTVSDAITSYDEIIKIYPKELVLLVHSRFTYADRIKNESDLLKHFGPESNSDLRMGRIVIATQVIEQSLDVDFDILISDLAPIDYIIQRLGRLFRHKRDNSGNRNEINGRGIPLIVLYGPEATQNPAENWYSEILKGASFVYADHAVLWKTQQAIENAGNKITTPGDLDTPDGIRNLMKKVYGEDALVTPKKLEKQETKSMGDSDAKDSMGRYNMLALQEGYSPKSSGHWYEEVHVPTRIGDAQVNVYLAKMEGNNLIPFEDGEFCWDLSTVKVRAALVTEKTFENRLNDLIASFKSNSKRLSETDFVVPMRLNDGIWICEALDKKKGPFRFVYTKERGFQVVIV